MPILKGTFTNVPVKGNLSLSSLFVNLIALLILVPYLGLFVLAVLELALEKFSLNLGLTDAGYQTLFFITIGVTAVTYGFNRLYDFRKLRLYEKRQIDFRKWAKSNSMKLYSGGDLKFLANSIIVRVKLPSLSVKRLAVSKEMAVGEVYFELTKDTKHGQVVTGYVYQNVIVLPLSREVPNVFFDSKIYKAKALKWAFKNNQNDQLEDPFPRYFDILLPGDYHIDLRSIITPDTMEALIELYECDIELAGTNLIIYSPLSQNTVDALNGLTSRALKLKKQIEDNINTYYDERLPKEVGKWYVHPTGYKLKIRNTRLIKMFIWLAIYAAGLAIIEFVND